MYEFLKTLIALVVPKRGVEPRRADAHMTLNHARLPIPPLRHAGFGTIQYSLFLQESQAVL